MTAAITDRELLELAAKAAGLAWEWNACAGGIQHIPHGLRHYVDWNPLTDDGDALRLAVKLRRFPQMMVMGRFVGFDDDIDVSEEFEPDPYGATRRAIVRAAAEIGRDMP